MSDFPRTIVAFPECFDPVPRMFRNAGPPGISLGLPPIDRHLLGDDLVGSNGTCSISRSKSRGKLVGFGSGSTRVRSDQPRVREANDCDRTVSQFLYREFTVMRSDMRSHSVEFLTPPGRIIRGGFPFGSMAVFHPMTVNRVKRAPYACCSPLLLGDWAIALHVCFHDEDSNLHSRRR